MKLVIQRVTEASVTIEGKIAGQIGKCFSDDVKALRDEGTSYIIKDYNL